MAFDQTLFDSPRRQRLFFQRMLKQAGLYNRKIHGRETDDFRRAMRRWQRRQGIQVTGEIDPQSILHLRSVLERYGAVSGEIKGVDKKTLKKIRESYGYMTSYLTIPELRKVIVEAVKEGWDQQRIEGKLRNTHWYRTTSATARQWLQQRFDDPATADQMRRKRQREIVTYMQELGLRHIDAETMARFVERSLREGWEDNQIRQGVLSLVNFNKERQVSVGGRVETTRRDVRSVAADQFQKLSERELNEWVKDILAEKRTLEDLSAQMARRAGRQWQHLDPVLADGATMRDLFSDHAGAIADDLNMDVDQIDFVNDPRWAEVLDVVDERSGEHRAMTTGEARRLARRDEAFLTSETGHNAAYEVASLIATEMGEASFS